MPVRPVNADDIMALFGKHGSLSEQAHAEACRILMNHYNADDSVSLVIALRGEDKAPRGLQGMIGSSVLTIITRDAETHFGAGINDPKTTLASAVLARALRQVSWGSVGNQVYQRTRERVLADRSLAESADKRMAEPAAKDGDA